MATKTDELKTLATNVLNDTSFLDSFLEALDGPSRRERQLSASVISLVAHDKPELVFPYVENILEALGRSEAQTRWEALDTLTHLVPLGPDKCAPAIPEAETALFDEDSGMLHLTALRFLCKIGAVNEDYSLKCWPLIDEAIQCYHGDYEFPEMMAAVIDFSCAPLAASVKTELAARMKFDAENSKGGLKKRAQQIIDNLK